MQVLCGFVRYFSSIVMLISKVLTIFFCTPTAEQGMRRINNSFFVQAKGSLITNIILSTILREENNIFYYILKYELLKWTWLSSIKL